MIPDFSLRSKLIKWGDFVYTQRIPVEFGFFLLVILNMISFPGRTGDILAFFRWSFLPITFWGLILLGLGIRIWAAGNLRKNKELTLSGPYKLVRHPLYLGSLIVYLTVFLTLGSAIIGFGLFCGLLYGLYLPLMIREERNLRENFPHGMEDYLATNRIIPDVTQLGASIQSDNFSFRLALKHSGIGSLWIVPGIVGLFFLLENVVLIEIVSKFSNEVLEGLYVRFY